jgi:hypothetical protein
MRFRRVLAVGVALAFVVGVLPARATAAEQQSKPPQRSRPRLLTSDAGRLGRRRGGATGAHRHSDCVGVESFRRQGGLHTSPTRWGRPPKMSSRNVAMRADGDRINPACTAGAPPKATEPAERA